MCTTGPETLVFTTEDSGSAEHPVVYKAIEKEGEGGAIISGGISELQLDWQPHRDGIFKAQTPTGLSIDQLFVSGVSQRMARYPNYDPAKKAEPYQGLLGRSVFEITSKELGESGRWIHSRHASLGLGRVSLSDHGQRRIGRGHVRRWLAEQSPDGHAQGPPHGRKHL